MPVFPSLLESDRLLLRPYRSQDAVALYGAVLESRDEVRPWLLWTRNILSVEDAITYQRHTAVYFEAMESLTLGIFHKEEKRLLGGICFHLCEWEMAQFEMGFWIRTSETGQGYASEAARKLIRFAFEDLAATRIEMWIEKDNRASRAVPEKIGFFLEGVMREKSFGGQLQDFALYAMIRADYEKEKEGIIENRRSRRGLYPAHPLERG